MHLPQIGTGWYVATAAAIVFEVVFPLGLGFVLHRRLKVSWRYFWFGALIFFLFQLISRVPAVQIIQSVIAPQLAASQTLTWLWLAILALTAGLFEEIGRFLGYRWFFRGVEKTWNKAVMYGAGHGGFESMVLVAGLSLISLINVLLIPQLNLGSLPAGTQKQIIDQFSAIAAQPGWLPLLGAYERLCTITFHIAMSVVVLQVFRRGQIGWLWLAVAAHAIFDFAAVAAAQILPRLDGHRPIVTNVLVEGIVTVFALLALWIIFALRGKPTVSEAAPNGEAPMNAAPAGSPSAE